MMATSMNPRMLALLQEEKKLQQSLGSSTARRIKFPQVGSAQLIRFLPVELGANKSWYVRNAQHWHNKKGIVCPRLVSADYGGDSEIACPICEASTHLNADSDEHASDVGFRLRAQLTYITYCCLLAIDDQGDGTSVDLSITEIINPYEFTLFQRAFDELTSFYKRGLNRSAHSVLDIETGNDFWAFKTKTGIRFEKQDPGPIFPLDDPARFDELIAQTFANIRLPRLKLPTEQEIAAFVRKAEADAYGDGDGGSNSNNLDANDDDDSRREHRPKRRGRFEEPTRRPSSQADDDDSEPAPTPRPPVRTSPARPAPLARANAAAPPEEPTASDPVDAPSVDTATDPVDAEPPADEAPPEPQAAPQRAPARQTAPARSTSPAVQAPARPVPPARAAAAPARPPAAARPTPPARSTAPAYAPPSTVDAEDDPGVADEANDPVPAASALPGHPAAMRPAHAASPLASKIKAATARGN